MQKQVKDSETGWIPPLYEGMFEALLQDQIQTLQRLTSAADKKPKAEH